MTRLREVSRHLETLGEIREIMNAMKNLAIIESRRLDKVIQSQRELIHTIDLLAADFNTHYPFALTVNDAYHLYILIGAERGFCGSFNHQLLQRYRSLRAQAPAGTALTIVIGRKFTTVFANEPHHIALAGASAHEEIGHVLNKLVPHIDQLQSRYGALACTVLRQDHLQRDVVAQALLPPFRQPPAHYTASPIPPQLYLTPAQFLSDLIQQYLFANLFGSLSASLLAENQSRVTHLEGAIRHLDERSLELGRKRRSLRQEEIIEEIEVILLNAEQGDRDADVAELEPASETC